MMRVGVVTRRPVHAELWAVALAREADLELCVAVTSVEELEGHREEIDVVLLDMDATGEAALASRLLAGQWPDVAVAVVEEGVALQAVVERIRTVEPSLTVLSGDALRSARGTYRRTERRPGVMVYPRLTVREREVLESLSRGNSTSAIAAELRMSVHTCRGHLRTLMAKLGARTQLEVVAFVREQGLPDA